MFDGTWEGDTVCDSDGLFLGSRLGIVVGSIDGKLVGKFGGD